MSDAMQVALDALRMAGRDDVADAMPVLDAFLVARDVVIQGLLNRATCAACECAHGLQAHRRDCVVLALVLAHNPEALKAELVTAEFEARWMERARWMLQQDSGLASWLSRTESQFFRLGNTQVEVSEHMKDGAVYAFQRLPPVDVSFGSPHHRAMLTNIDYDPPPTEKEKK
jgi:hypothetical protein